MGLHFRAFSFVDRITSLDDQVRIRGRYTIPAGLSAFPASLATEAVGQLAAWAAMAAADFRRRPVAGIGGAVEYKSWPQPGQVLDLSADLELDDDAIAYNGVASANGVPVVRLKHCVGPMVPVEEFDDPGCLRDRFALLRGAGTVPGGFYGLPSIPVIRAKDSSLAQSRCATLQVPASADFFADHFPRRPVFPGSLLMHLNLELAAELAAELPLRAAGDRWQLWAVRDVKLRAFVSPGETLQTELRLAEQSDRSAIVSVETRNAKRLVGGARVEFVLEERQ